MVLRICKRALNRMYCAPVCDRLARLPGIDFHVCGHHLWHQTATQRLPFRPRPPCHDRYERPFMSRTPPAHPSCDSPDNSRSASPRLVQAMSSWPAKARHAPSRHCTDARACGYVSPIEYTPPLPFPSPRYSMWLVKYEPGAKR